MHTGAPDSIRFVGCMKFLLHIGVKLRKFFLVQDMSHRIHYKGQIEASVTGLKLVRWAVNSKVQSLEPNVHGPPVTMPLVRKSASTNWRTAITSRWKRSASVTFALTAVDQTNNQSF